MFFDQLGREGIDRRQFVGLGALAAGSIGLSGLLSSCSAPAGNTVKKTEEAGQVAEGKWVTAGCGYDCGHRCLNKAYVVDGVVVRQKTDDTHEDTPDYPQQRACARGRGHRNMVYAADKLKYPLKRKHYEVGGGDRSLRGTDEWERISWDEALGYVATELKNAKENYGNESILFPHFVNIFAIEISNVLNAFGGYIMCSGAASQGSHKNSMVLGSTYWQVPINDRFDYANSETFIMLGVNPAWSSLGNPASYYLRAKQAGARFISIDPFYNDTAAAMGAEWIPIRLGTDMAFLLGVAHTLIAEDDPESNPLIDWDFLKRCTVGFDETMMPEGADPERNFKNYVLGGVDGIPKTPEWASEICGVAPERIRAFASDIAKDKKVTLICGWSTGRIAESDALPQILLAVGSMTGHMGKAGHSWGATCHRVNINGGPFLYSIGSNGFAQFTSGLTLGGSTIGAGGANAFEIPIKMTITNGDVANAILDGKGVIVREDGKGTPRDLDIHVIANFCGNPVDTHECGLDRMVEAFRKVDFVFSTAQYTSSTALFSDIILPLSVFWERTGDISVLGTRDALIASSQVIEPMYEVKSSYEVALALGKALGVDTDELFPFDEKQAYFNILARTTVVDADGETSVPLATITGEDIEKWGVEGEAQEGRLPLDELLEKGVFQHELKPGDNYSFIAFEDFVSDPEKNPRSTPSGKFEIYSQAYADFINAFGYSVIDPLPLYKSGPERYEESFDDWENKVKGEYPYQIYSIHYPGHAHTNFSNSVWLQEAFGSPLYLSTLDAAEHGISDTDTVLVESKWGKILRRATVTSRIMPGTIAMVHGSWKDINKNGIDEGGNDNSLCGTPTTGGDVEGYNSLLVKISKWSGAPLVPDFEKPRRVFLDA
ncbi:MAG: molybdopterin-dependent oxidoreductase [Eggerthellaceae bacterium]|nr:molybdopterin-dependent oxidoreductase [Eggerthellaceae bacterium]